MAAKNPRINMVLEAPLFRTVRDLARREGISTSQKARDLIRDALELIEDIGLDHLASERLRSGKSQRLLTLSEMRQRTNS